MTQVGLDLIMVFVGIAGTLLDSYDAAKRLRLTK